MENITDVFVNNLNTIHCNGNPCYEIRYVVNVCEDDSAIKVCSASKIKGLEKGWFGSLYYNAYTYTINSDKSKETGFIHNTSSVVLKEIQINQDIEEPTYFTYVFLKI